jgi:predicted signal transduction protein with EAL and GGDEF domain
MLKTQQIDTKIAINFPAEGFDDPRYEETLFQVMHDSCLTANHLQLEVLETQDSGEMTESRKAFIQRLMDAGVEIAEDDLGSGHSSLLRLDQYAFDEVKIDQGLVRGVMHNPKRAVEFILYLTRLAHAFNIPVTVEGLENLGMLEAAAILGADRGQGYGIARPMPADALPAWYQNYHYSVHPTKPKTAIGALAGYLLWDMQITSMSERPELVAEFVGAKALVDEFITANGLQGSAIDELLRRNHELAAARGEDKEKAGIVRAELIKELTAHWQAEMH